MAENNLQGATAKKIKESHVPNQTTSTQKPKDITEKAKSIPGSKGNTTDGKRLPRGKKSEK